MNLSPLQVPEQRSAFTILHRCTQVVRDTKAPFPPDQLWFLKRILLKNLTAYVLSMSSVEHKPWRPVESGTNTRVQLLCWERYHFHVGRKNETRFFCKILNDLFLLAFPVDTKQKAMMQFRGLVVIQHHDNDWAVM